MRPERQPLELDEILVFDFGSPRSVRVTMKGVPDPLDVLFVRKCRLLTVVSDLQPESELPAFPSTDMLLELKAGAADYYEIDPATIEWVTLVRANERR